MKKISFFRHGKSSWKYPVEDVHRPLSGRGLRQASSMAGACLLEQPDLVLSSPASRAYATALIYVKECQLPLEMLRLCPELYAGDTQDVLKVLWALPEDVHDLWLFGHNPGLNEVLAFLLGEEIVNIVTSAYVTVHVDVRAWPELRPDKGQLLHFNCPEKSRT
jgi:phosphohistidine phosphatase